MTSMSSKRTIESMRSCHAILEHMLKKAQQLRGFSRCQKGEKTTVKDTKLAHRIARVSLNIHTAIYDLRNEVVYM